MKFTKVTFTNFGPHASAVLDFNAGTVGIIGPNGSGKSNILTGLRWLVTGKLSEAKETYIRNYNPDLRQSAAKIVGEFIHNGVVGTLTRSTTKTTASRELNYDGVVDTSDAVVTSRLESLFGDVSLSVISEAGFIPQGELNDLLFGSQTVREMMFVKLLGLSHLEKVSVAAAEQARLLASSVTDRSSAKQTLSVLVEETRTKRDESNRTFTATGPVDQTANLNKLRAMKATQTKHEQVSAELTRSQKGLDTARNKMLDLMTESALPLNVAVAMQAVVKTAQDKIYSLTDEVSNFEKIEKDVLRDIGDAEAVAKVKDLIDTGSGKVLTLENTLRDLGVTNISELPHVREFLNSLRTGMNAKKLNEAELVKYDRAVKDLPTQSEVESVHLILPVEDEEKDLAEKRSQLAEVVAELRQVNSVISSLQNIAAGCADDGCPLCGNKDLPESLHDTLRKRKEDLDARNTSLSMAVQLALDIINNKKRDNAKSVKARDDASRERISAEAALLQCRKVLEEVNAKLDADYAEVDSRIPGLANRTDWLSNPSNFGRCLYTAYDELVLTKSQLTSDQAQWVGMSELSKSLDKAALTAKLAEIRSSNIDDVKNRLAAAKANLSKTTEFINSYRDASADYNRLYLEFTDCSERLTSVSEELKSFLISGNVDELIADAEVKQRMITDHISTMQSLDNQVKDLTSKLAELDLLDAQDEKKKKVITELKEISGWFKRDGIVMKYIQRKFDTIIELTNISLSILESNFSVMSSDEPVTFAFKRSDVPDSSVMHQSKLSGGQRVRLSLAFLIAFHKLVIPELGCMVLDEPSLHLDDDSKENLKELIIDIGRKQAPDSQIIVCDHSHVLTSAFERLISVPQGGFA